MARCIHAASSSIGNHSHPFIKAMIARINDSDKKHHNLLSFSTLKNYQLQFITSI